MRVLKVRGVPGVSVSNPHTVSMRFVGKEVPTDGTSKDCDQSVADHPDLRLAIKQGDLVACDAETAKLAGIKFVAAKAEHVAAKASKSGE